MKAMLAITTVLALVLALGALTGCSSKNEGQTAPQQTKMTGTTTLTQKDSLTLDSTTEESGKQDEKNAENGKNLPSASNGSDTDKKYPQKLIRQGTINGEVSKMDAAADALRKLAVSLGGYVSGENFYVADETRYGSMTLRIPAGNFDALFDKLKGIYSSVSGKTMTVDDVTAEYYDTETRLATKKQVLAQYYDILKRAGSIKDVLAVESEIRGLVEEIESFEGKLRYLGDQVSLSTVTVSMHEPYRLQTGSNFLSNIGKFLKYGLQGLKAVVYVIVLLWPAWILGIIVFGIIALRRRLKSKNSVKQ